MSKKMCTVSIPDSLRDWFVAHDQYGRTKIGSQVCLALSEWIRDHGHEYPERENISEATEADAPPKAVAPAVYLPPESEDLEADSTTLRFSSEDLPPDPANEGAKPISLVIQRKSTRGCPDVVFINQTNMQAIRAMGSKGRPVELDVRDRTGTTFYNLIYRRSIIHKYTTKNAQKDAQGNPIPYWEIDIGRLIAEGYEGLKGA